MGFHTNGWCSRIIFFAQTMVKQCFNVGIFPQILAQEKELGCFEFHGMIAMDVNW